MNKSIVALAAAAALGAAPAAAQNACVARTGIMLGDSAIMSDSAFRSMLVEAALVPAGAELVTVEAGSKPEMRNLAEVRRDLTSMAARMVEISPGALSSTLLLRVEPDGSMGPMYVARSSGVPTMDRAAQDVFRRARFRPATREGCPLAVWMLLPVTFQTRN